MAIDVELAYLWVISALFTEVLFYHLTFDLLLRALIFIYLSHLSVGIFFDFTGRYD